MVALSRQQRRALREIEERLAAEDLALAGLLRRAEGTRLERLMRGGPVTAALPVLFLGLFLIDAGVLSGWLVILLSVLCVSASCLVLVMLRRDR
jgi:hypothetical protein